MTGLLLIFIIAAWLLLVYGLVRLVTARLPARPWRAPLRMALYAALLPLPVIDEVVGVRQFLGVCRENSTVTVDPAKAAGRTVFLAQGASPVAGTWIPVTLTHWRYYDVTTRELVVSYNTVRVSGGRLITLFPLWDGGAPFILSRTYCQPERLGSGPNALLKQLGIGQVEPPRSK
jgi:hypothetical protein